MSKNTITYSYRLVPLPGFEPGTTIRAFKTPDFASLSIKVY